GVGGCEVKVESGALREPFPDERRLMGAVVIHDNVRLQSGGHISLDQIQELAEFRGTMATMQLTNDAAGLQFQRRKQRSGPVTLVVVGAPLGLAGPHRQ